MSDTDRVDALVVGAGIAGLYELHLLRGLGFATRVLEAADGVGGTWYWNRYPGARCDVESYFYAYSFDPELEQEWEWTEKYPTQPEILRYLNHVADRYDLRRDITFGTRVTAATYDEGAQRWTVTTDTGEEIDTQFLIMATGCLSTPKTPEVPGAERFTGPTYLTSRWPHEGVDFTGMRVGLIGTGSSGVQSIPVIARQASELTVFQRTPNFSFPAGNRPIDQEAFARVKSEYRELREQQRSSFAGFPGPPPTHGALEVSDDERLATYEAGWAAGTIGGMIGTFNDTLLDRASNDTLAEFIRGKIRGIVKDPQVAEDLCPTTHPVGTKRPCLDSDYFATFNEEHVRLVNLRRTPIVEITARGIRTTEAEHEVDAIVFATGFDAVTGTLLAVDFTGVGGMELREQWADGPRTYLGIGIHGFPNLFTVTGPTSPSVLSNMMVSIEQHVEWIAGCLAHLREEGIVAIEPTAEAEDAWMRHAEEVGNATLYPLADSWYMGANVPGKPRVFMPYIGGVGPYRAKCDEVVANGYAGFELHVTGAGLDGEALERLTAAIEADVDGGLYDGAVVMLGRHGDVALHEAIGFADRDAGRAMQADDIFRVLSLTKAFTNALILRAISRGELSTATKVVEVIPEFRGGDRFRGAGKDRITVGHLLTHRSGLPLTPTPVPYERLGRLDLVLEAIYELDVVSEPGGPVNYSPALNHALMGEILRRLSGDGISMRDLLRRDLFEPLGMTSTALGAPRAWADRLVPLKARFTSTGWLTEHDVEVLNDVISEEAEMPWVGGVTTAEDVFRFAEMLRRGGEYDGTRWIAPAVLDVATRNQTGTKPNELYGRLAQQNGWEVLPAFIGLGFMLAGEGLAPAMYGTFTSPRTFGNYGAGSTIFWVDPERDLTLVILTAGVLSHAPNIQRFHRLSDMAVAAAL